MPEQVKPRRYDSSRRKLVAAQTRSSILAAARELFVSRGYGTTTVAAIAERAGVAQDTVYASVGTKPAIFRSLVESALSGRDEPVPGAQREYAEQMRAALDVRTKLAIYAAAVTTIQGRLAPLDFRAAAGANPELARLWREISERRARNMRDLVDDLATTGELRADAGRDEIADIIWAMNSSEYYAMLVLERGWTPERFQRWLLDGWTRLLLP
ncbi:MAG TPA: TetR/AcrR family transcriptional regulator [Acidothermaceae bacterium]|nr:TetR/AcrR family transcriptional regulator [Acidothermaceae bacterium]